MFNARQITLSSGSTYDMPVVLEPADYINYGVYGACGPLNLCFLADGGTVVLNQLNLSTIKLDGRKRDGRRDRTFAKLVLNKEIIFTDIKVISPDDYEYANIPKIIGGGLNQFTWSCAEGTFITHDANIVSLVEKDGKVGRASKVVPRNALHVSPDVLDSVSPQAVQKKIG